MYGGSFFTEVSARVSERQEFNVQLAVQAFRVAKNAAKNSYRL